MEFKPLVGLTYELFFTLANVLILFLILRKILFKKIIDVMDARDADIKNNIEAGQKAKEEGMKFKSEYETKIQDARDESQMIVDFARKRAEEKSDTIISEARKEAEYIKQKANNEIAKEKEQAFNNIKSEISEIAVLAASKVIEKDIDKAKHEDLIENFIKEVGEAKND
ncbi:MAG: F0F1 ATP synthase subunit B [Peptostreptococcus stomatis]|uniref:F0F1 ATP synthase subunit B n=1 Tax=Peptostreptococcus stomatis TaxID=341694 RepID=UPI001A38F4C2|nr:F0F1 ATP synthase subunit B [Peptostreptococcus stomatis]MBL6466095.1 F0F1 ATP synthase subunit B [Peptostreptococcus stomatis]